MVIVCPRPSRAAAAAWAAARQTPSIGRPKGATSQAHAEPAGVGAHLGQEGPVGGRGVVPLAPIGRAGDIQDGGRVRHVACDHPLDDAPLPRPHERRDPAPADLEPDQSTQEAGMRIDPPPSLACATGNRPAAVAAPAPPLDPPGVRSRFQGLREMP